jgi:hypothetical protein
MCNYIYIYVHVPMIIDHDWDVSPQNHLESRTTKTIALYFYWFESFSNVGLMIDHFRTKHVVINV